MPTIGLIALLLMSGLAQDAGPDEVTLQDGSRIVGTVSGITDGVLTIKSDSAAGGEITVKFGDVKSLRVSGTQTLALKNGNILRGSLSAQDGVLSVAGDGVDPISVPMAEVAGLNLPPKKAITHSGFVGMSGRITDGNSRTKSVATNGIYEARTESTRLSFRGDWNYAEDQGVLSARNASGTMKYDLFLTDRVFAYANTLFEGDEFADLNLRSTLGCGVGVQFVDAAKDKTNWSFYEEAGISFFDEDFDAAQDNNYAAARVSGKLDWEAIDKRVLFFHYHEVYFGFEDQDDVYADTQTGVRLNIVDNFYATAQVNYRWDNTPAAGTLRSDTEYLWGLGYSFSF